MGPSFPRYMNIEPEFDRGKPLSDVGSGYNELTHAICYDFDLKKTYRIMNDYDEPGSLDQRGMSVLHETAKMFYYDPDQAFRIIKKCVDLGISINLQSGDGSTPFHYLYECVNDEEIHLEMMRMMMEAGADPFIRNEQGYSVFQSILMGACPLDTKIRLIKQILMYIPREKWDVAIGDILLLPYDDSLWKPISAEENIKLIKKFGGYVDLTTIENRIYTPLIIQAFNAEYSLEETYNVVKELLKRGADPNGTSMIGRTAILKTLERAAEDLPYAKKLLRLLVNKGCDPYAVTLEGEGAVRSLTDYLDTDLSLKQKEKISEILFGQKIAEEMLYRRLLANTFYIDRCETKIFQERIPLEGVYEGKSFYKHLIAKNNSFFKKLASDLDDPQNSDYWKEVMELIDDRTFHTLEFLNEQKIAALKQVLLRIPKLQRLSVNLKKFEDSQIDTLFRSDENFSAMISHKGKYPGEAGHKVGYYFHDQYVLVCNRGYASGRFIGVTVHQKSSIPNFDRFVCNIQYGTDAMDFTASHFPSRISDDEFSDNIVYDIAETKQRGGHCPVTSFNSAELAMLFMMIKDIVRDEYVAENLARAIKKVHTSNRREEILRDYLNLHSEGRLNQVPHDADLLSNIADLITSNSLKDIARREMVVEWAAEYDDGLYRELTFIPKTPGCEIDLEQDYESFNSYYSDTENDMEEEFPPLPPTPTAGDLDDFFDYVEES